MNNKLPRFPIRLHRHLRTVYTLWFHRFFFRRVCWFDYAVHLPADVRFQSWMPVFRERDTTCDITAAAFFTNVTVITFINIKFMNEMTRSQVVNRVDGDTHTVVAPGTSVE
ncbi:hypothetical protein JN27_20620 [Massilia sp. BSC265]|nr:hypothetical protein JN27_20620 [Massilia sp. BSC265]